MHVHKNISKCSSSNRSLWFSSSSSMNLQEPAPAKRLSSNSYAVLHHSKSSRRSNASAQTPQPCCHHLNSQLTRKLGQLTVTAGLTVAVTYQQAVRRHLLLLVSGAAAHASVRHLVDTAVQALRCQHNTLAEVRRDLHLLLLLKLVLLNPAAAVNPKASRRGYVLLLIWAAGQLQNQQ